MRFFERSVGILSAIVLVSQLACKKDTINQPVIQQPVLLGFEDKFALRLVLVEPFLYVCAGSDGIWRLNVRENVQQWEYLGLADITLGRYTNVGALDMDILHDDILVAYNGSAPHIPPESTISVWRSTNGGAAWFRSDTGIPESIPDPYESNTLTSLQRSPNEPSLVIGWIDPTCYRSTDGGDVWTMIFGERGVFAGSGHVRWHPFRHGEVWFFGETAVFAPYCRARQHYGASPKVDVSFDSLGFPSDAAVDDIAFDAGNPDIIYASTSYGVIKTTNGGYAWRRNALTLPDNGFVFCMVHHPSTAGLLYLAGGRRIYATHNGGLTVELLAEIPRGFITSLVWDAQGNQLLIGTTEGGIYSLK